MSRLSALPLAFLVLAACADTPTAPAGQDLGRLQVARAPTGRREAAPVRRSEEWMMAGSGRAASPLSGPAHSTMIGRLVATRCD